MDSILALEALISNIEEREIFKNIRINIKMHRKIKLYWTKTDVGNYGNERADKLAKSTNLKEELHYE